MNAVGLASGCGGAGADEPTAAVSLVMRPHQQSAFDEAVRRLDEHDRVTIALPCGTGKTLLGQRLAQHLGRHGRSAILVLVPSVALLAQTMRAWLRHSPRPLAVFVLCHDASVSSADLHVPVSTSAATLAAWVGRAQRQIRRPVDPQVVVFATYQSSPRIEQAHRDHGLAPWHVVIADEAHCAAGQLEAAFATVVHNSKIPTAVRIFLTATPRIRGRSAGVLCMDDPGMFGPVVAPLAVRAAIDARLLSDYVVAVVTVTDADVRAAVTDPRRSITVDSRAVPADQVATQLTVAAAARAYGLRRVMVFHNSVEASRRFSTGLGKALAGDQLAEGLVAMHIDGSTGARRRAQCLAVLAEPGDDRWAVLSNVRCLGVGVDVPALDGVVFASPRSSPIDIIQSVGRALRVDPSRLDPAVIVLPVFVEAGGGDVAQQVAASSFRHVYRTLLALADQDAELVGELRRGLQRRRRAPNHDQCDGDPGERLQVLDASGTFAPAQVLTALQVETLRLLSPGWDFGFDELRAYLEEHGHTRVSASYTTESGYPLGAWVRGQRRRRGRLADERIAALESTPGWVWNLHDAAWQDAFDRLAAFAGEHGHTRIPRDHRGADGFLLFQWASDQRREHLAGTLDAERAAMLQSLPGWMWRPAGQRWEFGFAQLEEFAAATGQASPSQNYVTERGYRLGEWVAKQRCAHARGQLDEQRAALLESLPRWQWDPLEARWRAGLAELVRYAAQHGHLRVPRSYTTAGGDQLGKWVDNQRSAKRAGTLAPHRVSVLETLPDWTWTAPAAPRLKGAPR